MDVIDTLRRGWLPFRVLAHGGYGWQKDEPDVRDFIYAPPAQGVSSSTVDLRGNFPPPFSQGKLGSCTANVIAAAMQYARRRQGLLPDFIPSRLFIYYNTRLINGMVNEDSGAQLRMGIKSVCKYGICAEEAVTGIPPETIWPYDILKFRDRPPQPDYTWALNNQVIQYSRIKQNIQDMRACLASGFPFGFGMVTYDYFESPAMAQSGILSLPRPQEQQTGGHAVLAVGYDDASQRFIVRNSWGTQWGLSGYFTVPYAYLDNEDLAQDVWTIRLIETGR